MCSTGDSRLAQIGEAIDEVAAAMTGPHSDTPVAELASRLADIWAMVADLDPAIAERLPGYGQQAR